MHQLSKSGKQNPEAAKLSDRLATMAAELSWHKRCNVWVADPDQPAELLGFNRGTICKPSIGESSRMAPREREAGSCRVILEYSRGAEGRSDSNERQPR